MPRYIDADALIEKIRRCEFDITGRGIVYDAGEVQSFINFMPTADVAPKSEVERLTVELEAMRGAANSYKMHYENAKTEIAREIFEEIEFDIANLDFDREETRAIAIEGVIANAKKKYTEENV